MSLKDPSDGMIRSDNSGVWTNPNTGIYTGKFDSWMDKLNNMLHPKISTSVDTDVKINPVGIIVALGVTALIVKFLFFGKK